MSTPFVMLEFEALDRLDPFELKLLAHYRRRYFETGKPVRETTRETAEGAKISTGKISPARKVLADEKYITLKPVFEPGTSRQIATEVIPKPCKKDRSPHERTREVHRSPDEHTGEGDRSSHEHTGSGDQGDRSLDERTPLYKRLNTDTSNEVSSEAALIGPLPPPITKWGHQVGLSFWYIEVDGWKRTLIQVQVTGESEKRVRIEKPDGTIRSVKPDSLFAERPTLERSTTPIQDVIAEFGYHIAPDQPISPKLERDLAQLEAQIMTTYPKLTADHLRAAYESREERYRPSDALKIISMLGEYRDHLKGKSNGRSVQQSGTGRAGESFAQHHRGTGSRSPVGPRPAGIGSTGPRRPPPGGTQRPVDDAAILSEIRERRAREAEDAAGTGKRPTG